MLFKIAFLNILQPNSVKNYSSSATNDYGKKLTKNVSEFDAPFYVGSFVVKPRFTNVLLTETLTFFTTKASIEIKGSFYKSLNHFFLY